MNIEKTGTFTIDLEPNWNAIIRVALEMLDNADPEMKKVGAEMVRTCVEPMAAKGGHLIIGEATNFCESCLDDRVLKSGELVEFAEEASTMIADPRLSAQFIKAEQEATGHLPEQAVDRNRAINFIKLIGQWWEADRQARRS